MQQGGAHRVLVELNRFWVTPAHNPPDATFEIGGLTGKQAEEDLRGAAFDSHDLLPLEITGACSSTSRRERIGSPVGNSSLTQVAVLAGSFSAR